MNREKMPRIDSSSENEEEIIKRVKGKILEIFKGKDRNNRLKLHDVIYKFSSKLLGKYGDRECREYALFHVLIGSSPKNSWNEFPKLDFPGEDSIEKFVNDELYNIS